MGCRRGKYWGLCSGFARECHCYLLLSARCMRTDTLLCELAWLRKATTSFIMPVHPSVRMEQLGSQWTNFHDFFFYDSSKICRENWSLIKIWQEKPILCKKTDEHFWSYLAQFFLEWEMFQTKFVEKIGTNISFSVTCFRKSYCLWDKVEKYRTAGQATNDNMAHGRFMLDA